MTNCRHPCDRRINRRVRRHDNYMTETCRDCGRRVTTDLDPCGTCWGEYPAYKDCVACSGLGLVEAPRQRPCCHFRKGVMCKACADVANSRLPHVCMVAAREMHLAREPVTGETKANVTDEARRKAAALEV